MDPLSLDEVRHIGSLCRVGLSDAEAELYRAQLSNILGHFDGLRAIPTDGVEPSSHAVDLVDVLRPDEVGHSELPREDVLANAPSQEEGQFRVRAVLQE